MNLNPGRKVAEITAGSELGLTKVMGVRLSLLQRTTGTDRAFWDFVKCKRLQNQAEEN